MLQKMGDIFLHIRSVITCISPYKVCCSVCMLCDLFKSFISDFLTQDPRKRFGATLGALSGGRVGITGMAWCNLQMVITIAVRYSAVRRQFGPDENSEIPVLEYQLQVIHASSLHLTQQTAMLVYIYCNIYRSFCFI